MNADPAPRTSEVAADSRERPCFHDWHPYGSTYKERWFVCWYCGAMHSTLTWLAQEYIRNQAQRAAALKLHMI